MAPYFSVARAACIPGPRKIRPTVQEGVGGTNSMHDAELVSIMI